jgi:hypothetical protein
MRAQAKLHQRFCLWQAGHWEPVIGLVTPHRFARLIVPATIRLCIQVACLNQSLLDFLNAFRFRTEVCPPTPIRGGSLGLGRNVPCRRVVRGAVLARASRGAMSTMSTVLGGRVRLLLRRASAFLWRGGVSGQLGWHCPQQRGKERQSCVGFLIPVFQLPFPKSLTAGGPQGTGWYTSVGRCFVQ